VVAELPVFLGLFWLATVDCFGFGVGSHHGYDFGC
jgi:hypothetical protein